MSAKIVIAQLQGYELQVLPTGILSLNKVYENKMRNCEAETIKSLVKAIPGFERCDRQATSDSYEWFCCLHFSLEGNGRLAVLLPYSQDGTQKDGLRLDRSIATYVQGNTAATGIDSVLESLTTAFQAYNQLEKKAIEGKTL